MLRHLLAIGTVLWTTGAAGAGVVLRLRNGRTLAGEVISQNSTSLRFRTKVGIEIVLKPEEILEIEEPAEPLARPRTRPASRPASRPSATRPAHGQAEHSASCPMSCGVCERLFRHSLDHYCATVMRRPRHSPIPVKLGGWPALQAPACGVLGLVLLGEGEATGGGLHQRTVLSLTRYVGTWSERDHSYLRAHRTWAVAFSLLFLAELHRAAPSASLMRKIQRLVRLLESGRQGANGWCHTLERSGYGPFVAVTIWCAAALSSAREQGAAVRAEGLSATYTGLRQSIGRCGGASYYTHAHSLLSVGRTGGVLWVLRRYAGGDGPESRRALGFLLRHVQDAPHGHASGLMNFAWSALGVSSCSPAVREAFWKAHRKTLLNARQADGAFAVQPWKDLGYTELDSRPPRQAQGTTWPDPMYGDGWATPWMLLAWQAGRGRSVLTARPTTTQPAATAPRGGPAGTNEPAGADEKGRPAPTGPAGIVR